MTLKDELYKNIMSTWQDNCHLQHAFFGVGNISKNKLKLKSLKYIV